MVADLRTTLKALALTAALLLGLVGPASAQEANDESTGGIGVAPAVIDVDNALRSGTAASMVRLHNYEDRPVEFTLSGEGDIKDWVSFTTIDDPSTTLESVTVPPGATSEIRVHLTIPATTPNAEYKGGVNVLSALVGDAAKGQSGAGVGLGALIEVNIDVVGTETRQGILSDAFADPAEVGMTQRFVAQIRNDGNVLIDPLVRVELSKDGTPVQEISNTVGGSPIDPSATGDVEVLWDTSVHQGGDYTAKVTVTDEAGAGGLLVGTKEFGFRLQPRGFYTRAGELMGMRLLNDPGKGDIAQFEARFFNTGEIETQGTFVGELYKGDDLVETIESMPILARKGETVDVPFSVRLPDEAEYRLVGKVNFEGKQTNTEKLEFRIGRDATSRAAIAVAVLLLATILVMVWRFRRRHSSHGPTRDGDGRRQIDMPTAQPDLGMPPAKSPELAGAAKAIGDAVSAHRATIQLGTGSGAPRAAAPGASHGAGRPYGTVSSLIGAVAVVIYAMRRSRKV